jgi:YD repeat-containing protein
MAVGPVLARGSAEGVPATEGAEGAPVAPPSAQQVAEGIERAEVQEAARRQELESPQAVDERHISETAYANLTPAESRALLQEAFPESLAALESDLARSLENLHLVRTYGEDVATVRDSEGETSLLEASIPLRVENEEGELEKVKLGLTEGESGFEPENPVTELLIPPAADEGISVGQEGLTITPQVQESEGQSLHGTDVFYPEVAADTDMMVSPIGAGVEIFDQLRSSASPETLHFHLDLPAGASLSANSSGGAEVTKEGKPIAIVPPPGAVDAQGTNVPLEIEAEGETLTLRVPHPEGKYALPILVDPAIQPISENYEATWYWGSNLDALENPAVWKWSGNDESQTYILRSTHCLDSSLCSPSGRGLFLSAMNRNIPANVYTEWYYTVPGETTFIPSIYPEPSAAFNPFWRANNNCSYNSYPQPYDFDGAFDAAGNWTYISTNRAQNYGYDTLYTKAKGLAFGIGTTASVNLPCWRDIMLGGVAVRLDDPENPTLGSVTGFPTGWIGSGKSFTATANLSDPGLGVQNAKVYPSGMPSVPYVSEGSQCPGTKTHPCPASLAAPISLKAENFDEGEKKVEVSGWDPTGKVSGTYTTTMKVDRHAPKISVSGQLMSAINKTEGELSLPTYNLQIEATDGSNANPESKRSGVKSIEVFLDKEATAQASWTQECPGGSCSMTKSFQLKLTELAPEAHVLKVIAKDQLNQTETREIEFEYVPAMGIKDEYLMQYFPLPDGKDHSGEETSHGPELAVNVANGNLVFHERDVNVEGPNVDLEVEPVYNSQLPTSQNTEWGDGWSLAQTPKLQRLTTTKGRITDGSGRREGSVILPAETGGTRFTSALKSTTTKAGSSAYTLTDESGETGTSVAFDSSGHTDELQTESPASVDYSYESGALSKIEVKDPTSSATPPPAPPPLSQPSTVPVYNSAFGSEGTGSGQFKHPADVALDAGGHLWVVDENNNRLQEFTRAGEFIRSLGSTGTGNSQFTRPTAVAVAPNGNLVVADSGNKRVEVFSESGTFVRAFGSVGTGNGQFSGSGPEGVAVDAKGNIWVSDTYGGRLEKFSGAGEFLKSISSKGSGSGQLGEPTGLAVAVNGTVFVADWQNNRVAVFNEAGEFVRQFGAAGTGNGQFSHPDEVNVDNLGKVWVGDQSNGRIEEFSQAGEYLAQFGASGTGAGQFSFGYPIGMTSDKRGRFWIADAKNNRIQKWTIPDYVPDYTPALNSTFGSLGSGNGQLKHPGDVALDAKGNLWVADSNNNRVEEFSPEGQYLGQFGTSGSGNGQLSRPAAVAIDSKGNFWVADSGNNRVEEFNEKGEYVRKFGSTGTGNGQFSVPEGIAVDPAGNVWVSDTRNARLEVFNEQGEFIRIVGSYGSGPGQLGEPCGIDFNRSGNAFVADWVRNRVEEYGPEGEFINQFGSAGSGNGQFGNPFALNVDANGIIWVSDTEHGRVEAFSEEGEYIRQFGSKGAGTGQFEFSYPAGIATSKSGQIWVTDTNSNRIQKWVTPTYEATEEFLAAAKEPNDPTVAVHVASGLVSSLEGAQAGTNTYAYSGDNRVSSTSSEGETKFQYDASGRMTRVELPNGTVGSATYDSTNRATSVTVDPAGAEPAKTTYFSYSSEPRRTTVTPETGKQITYEIAEDGSVFKSWTVAKAPEISLAGTIWVNAEKEIATGLNNLEVQAKSTDGIAAIEILIDGNTLVEERTCSQNYETEEIECQEEAAEWVVETGELAPGNMQVEAIVKDRLGNVSSKRFWVKVPYTPPPSLEEPTKPTFLEIKEYRHSHGLDLDLNPITEVQILNNRIYDLLAAWGNPATPEGGVARFAAEEWGVPMRPIDVAEMEYREWYINIDIPKIEEWGEAHPELYGGTVVNGAAGGIIRVGFTNGPSEHLAELKQQLSLVAQDRVTSSSTPQGRSLAALRGLMQEVLTQMNNNPSLKHSVSSVEVDMGDDVIHVGATDPSLVEEALHMAFGLAAPITVSSEPAITLNSGRVKAGENLRVRIYNEETGNTIFGNCTAGYGAYRNKPLENGGVAHIQYLLTAGHCSTLGEPMQKYQAPRGTDNYFGIGTVRKSSFEGFHNWETDALAVKLEGIDAPRYIYWAGSPPRRVTSAGWAHPGDELCFSGVKTGKVSCGTAFEATARPYPFLFGREHGSAWVIPFGVGSREGDSGAPVWDKTTGRVVGLLAGVTESRNFPDFWNTTKVSWATPLIQPKGVPAGQAPGIFGAPAFDGLDLEEAP